MSKKKPKSVYTAFRMPVDLREKAARRAEADGRSLSNYIKNLIKRDLGLSIREDEPTYGSKKRE